MSILGAQIKKEAATFKEKSQTTFEFHHFNPILSWQISVECWFPVVLPQTPPNILPQTPS